MLVTMAPRATAAQQAQQVTLVAQAIPETQAMREIMATAALVAAVDLLAPAEQREFTTE
jgi:hypothetical protein